MRASPEPAPERGCMQASLAVKTGSLFRYGLACTFTTTAVKAVLLCRPVCGRYNPFAKIVYFLRLRLGGNAVNLFYQ